MEVSIISFTQPFPYVLFSGGDWDSGRCLAADGKSRPPEDSAVTTNVDNLDQCEKLCNKLSVTTGCEFTTETSTCIQYKTPLSMADGDDKSNFQCYIYRHGEVLEKREKGACLDENGFDIVEGQMFLRQELNIRACFDTCLRQNAGFGCEYNTVSKECFVHTTRIEGATGYGKSICVNFMSEHIGHIENTCDNRYFKCKGQDMPGECINMFKMCNKQNDCIDGSDEKDSYCKAPLDVRLRPDGGNAGLLEVRRHGVWGTMCKNDIGQAEADIFCKMMGYSLGAKKGDAGYWTEKEVLYPVHGTWPVWHNRRTYNPEPCRSSMTSIIECSNTDPWPLAPFCEHKEDIYLFCSGEKKKDRKREVPSCLPKSETWKFFQCDTLVGDNAECIDMKHLCDGGKPQCKDESDQASKRCESSIETRLRPITHPLFPARNIRRAGLLEIRYKGVWGTVVGGDSFTDKEADVFCRMLGYKRASRGEDEPPWKYYDSNEHKPEHGPWPVWIHDKALKFGTCTGKENTILDCHDPAAWTQGSGEQHYNDVYLICDHHR